MEGGWRGGRSVSDPLLRTHIGLGDNSLFLWGRQRGKPLYARARQKMDEQKKPLSRLKTVGAGGGFGFRLFFGNNRSCFGIRDLRG